MKRAAEEYRGDLEQELDFIEFSSLDKKLYHIFSR